MNLCRRRSSNVRQKSRSKPRSGRLQRSSTSWTRLRRAWRREGRPRSVMPSAAAWAKSPHPRNWGGHQRAPSQPGQGGHCIRRSKESPVAEGPGFSINVRTLGGADAIQTPFLHFGSATKARLSHHASYRGVAEYHLVRINQPDKKEAPAFGETGSSGDLAGLRKLGPDKGKL